MIKLGRYECLVAEFDVVHEQLLGQLDFSERKPNKRKVVIAVDDVGTEFLKNLNVFELPLLVFDLHRVDDYVLDRPLLGVHSHLVHLRLLEDVVAFAFVHDCVYFLHQFIE